MDFHKWTCQGIFGKAAFFPCLNKLNYQKAGVMVCKKNMNTMGGTKIPVMQFEQYT